MNKKTIYKIIKQLCLGIKEIHNKNIIHRDIKPENIFINEKMEIKIGDFDISKQFNPNKEYMETLNRAGSIFYMAPEIIAKGIYNEKSDMYSLGCIIYELFTLSKYYNDREYDEIRKIDSKKYNNKWQDIIYSLLQIDSNGRMNINHLYNILLNYENKIIGKIYINKNNINKDIRIINSFENWKRENNLKIREDDYLYENEKEIKDNIDIKINGKAIEFTYYYKFKDEGKYIIEYTFKNNLTKYTYLFLDCDSLTNLKLSILMNQKLLI